MGTFHQDKGEFHGITVVVDTTGPKVLVGRCDEADDEKVVLLDVDVHEEGQNGKTKAQYVERAAKFGVWKKFDHFVLPRSEVASIRRLGEILGAGPKHPDSAGLASRTAQAPLPVSAPHASPAPLPAAPTPPTGQDSEAVVTLTPAAQAEVKRLLDAEHKQGAGLRLGVKGGGCSGLSYKLDFDQMKEGDLVISFPGFQVYLDRKSTIYLRGVLLDHQEGLSGRGFVFHNPNASNTCGCGESFSV